MVGYIPVDILFSIFVVVVFKSGVGFSLDKVNKVRIGVFRDLYRCGEVEDNNALGGEFPFIGVVIIVE